MPEQLYPVFEIPTITRHTEDDREQYFYPGPLFDFKKGDFAQDGQHQIMMVDGLDEYMIWCLKMLKTQTGACLSYPESGIDIDGALSEPNHEAICGAFERTITEGLMRNPRTERVYSFEFRWTSDSLSIAFVIKPRKLDAFNITMNVAI